MMLGEDFAIFMGELIDFKNTHGHCDVPRSYITPSGFKLGRRVANARLSGRITNPEWRQLLKVIGFEFETHQVVWMRFLRHLKEFVATHGHASPAAHYKSIDGFCLGQIAGRIRLHGHMKVFEIPERKKALDDLDFKF